MKIEKRVYRVFYKGGYYVLPLVVSSLVPRQTVQVLRKLNAKR